MKIRIITTFLIALTLTSCINLDKLFKTNYDTEKLVIAASIETIDFNDRRNYVSPEPDIKLKVFPKPRQFIEYYPKFNATHREIVSDIIEKNFASDDARRFKVSIEL